MLAFFKEQDGSVPFLEWFDRLSPKARDKLYTKLLLLENKGHELRRPHADYLRDKIYELRAKHQNVNYRILYFFYRESAIVISHGVRKEKEVPAPEIDKAVMRRRIFLDNPERFSWLWEHET